MDRAVYLPYSLDHLQKLVMSRLGHELPGVSYHGNTLMTVVLRGKKMCHAHGADFRDLWINLLLSIDLARLEDESMKAENAGKKLAKALKGGGL